MPVAAQPGVMVVILYAPVDNKAFSLFSRLRSQASRRILVANVAVYE